MAELISRGGPGGAGTGDVSVGSSAMGSLKVGITIHQDVSQAVKDLERSSAFLKKHLGSIGGSFDKIIDRKKAKQSFDFLNSQLTKAKKKLVENKDALREYNKYVRINRKDQSAWSKEEAQFMANKAKWAKENANRMQTMLDDERRLRDARKEAALEYKEQAEALKDYIVDLPVTYSKALIKSVAAQNNAFQEFRRMQHKSALAIVNDIHNITDAGAKAALSIRDIGLAASTLRKAGLTENLEEAVEVAGKLATVFNVDVAKSSDYVATKMQRLNMSAEEVYATMGGLVNVQKAFGITGDEAMEVFSQFGPYLIQVYRQGQIEGSKFEAQVLAIKGEYKKLGISADGAMQTIIESQKGGQEEMKTMAMLAGMTGRSIEELMTDPIALAEARAQAIDQVVKDYAHLDEVQRRMAVQRDPRLAQIKAEREETEKAFDLINKGGLLASVRQAQAVAELKAGADEVNKAWQNSLSDWEIGLEKFKNTVSTLWINSLQPFFGRVMGGMGEILGQLSSWLGSSDIARSLIGGVAGLTTVVGGLAVGFKTMKFAKAFFSFDMSVNKFDSAVNKMFGGGAPELPGGSKGLKDRAFDIAGTTAMVGGGALVVKGGVSKLEIAREKKREEALKAEIDRLALNKNLTEKEKETLEEKKAELQRQQTNLKMLEEDSSKATKELIAGTSLFTLGLATRYRKQIGSGLRSFGASLEKTKKFGTFGKMFKTAGGVFSKAPLEELGGKGAGGIVGDTTATPVKIVGISTAVVNALGSGGLGGGTAGVASDIVSWMGGRSKATGGAKGADIVKAMKGMKGPGGVANVGRLAKLGRFARVGGGGLLGFGAGQVAGALTDPLYEAMDQSKLMDNIDDLATNVGLSSKESRVFANSTKGAAQGVTEMGTAIGVGFATGGPVGALIAAIGTTGKSLLKVNELTGELYDEMQLLKDAEIRLTETVEKNTKHMSQALKEKRGIDTEGMSAGMLAIVADLSVQSSSGTLTPEIANLILDRGVSGGTITQGEAKRLRNRMAMGNLNFGAAPTPHPTIPAGQTAVKIGGPTGTTPQTGGASTSSVPSLPSGMPMTDIGGTAPESTGSFDMKSYMDRIAKIESGGSGGYQATNSQTSATGRYQFIAGTTLDVLKKAPSIAQRFGINVSSLRHRDVRPMMLQNPALQDAVMQSFTNQNLGVLSNSLPSGSITEKLLAASHFMGAGGAIKWVKTGGDPNFNPTAGTGIANVKVGRYMRDFPDTILAQHGAIVGGPTMAMTGETEPEVIAPVRALLQGQQGIIGQTIEALAGLGSAKRTMQPNAPRTAVDIQTLASVNEEQLNTQKDIRDILNQQLQLMRNQQTQTRMERPSRSRTGLPALPQGNLLVSGR